MAVPIFPQTREADLLSWSTAFDTRINLTPTVFNVESAETVRLLDAA